MPQDREFSGGHMLQCRYGGFVQNLEPKFHPVQVRFAVMLAQLQELATSSMVVHTENYLMQMLAATYHELTSNSPAASQRS